LDEFPKTEFQGRAIFHQGEAFYALGKRKEAIEKYNRLLALPEIGDSPYRCDAYYARGVAQQELDRTEDAIASFRQMISACGDDDSVGDVAIRLGDLLIEQERYGEAVKSLADALRAPLEDEDAAYSYYRQGFAHFANGDPGAAAKAYEELLDQYADSSFAATARLASAQSAYRAGDTDVAAKRFAEVTAGKDRAAATEAAHWLAKIRLADGQFKQAEKIAREQLKRGVEGDYANELKLDLAESIAADASRLGEAAKRYREVAAAQPNAKIAPRALYNAAFSAFQAKAYDDAIEAGETFFKRHDSHELQSDVRLILAEALLAAGDRQRSATQFQRLVEDASGGPSPAFARWVIRAASVMASAERTDAAIALLRQQSGKLDADSRQEANLLAGRLQIQAGRPADAVTLLADAASGDWEGATEAKLLAAEAALRAGQNDRATRWFTQVAKTPSALGVQAAFKLGTMAADAGDDAAAAKQFAQVVASEKEPELMPMALLGLGDALARLKRDDEALRTLDRLIREYPNHPMATRARLTRGMTLVALEKNEDARVDLETFLQSKPTGLPLAETLYELALLDQYAGAWKPAAEHLQRIVDEVPSFDALDDVLYRLGWAYFKDGDLDKSRDAFERQLEIAPEGGYALDAVVMSGETYFRSGQYVRSLEAYRKARQWIREADDTSMRLRDPKKSRIRELALLHGGQAAAQTEDFEEALQWYNELKTRFPSTSYLAQLIYELGATHQKLGDDDRALHFFDQASDGYRNEIGARARFMAGEIHFGRRDFKQAIGEFQRLMFGYGGAQAPDNIQAWQAKAGFEAGRCSELLASSAATTAAREKAVGFAERFYNYVIKQHAGSDLADKSRQRLEAIQK
ncbi:MAG: tetratricopeptide repeat protein, partial [Planctomycetota bacterium]